MRQEWAEKHTELGGAPPSDQAPTLIVIEVGMETAGASVRRMIRGSEEVG